MGPGGAGAAAFPGQQYLSDPMANMAMQYGGNLADQGKEYVQQNVSKPIALGSIYKTPIATDLIILWVSSSL